MLLMQVMCTQKRACKDFKIKYLRDYHYLYVQSYTFFLADVFENFRNTCLEIYELNPAKSFSAPVLAFTFSI